MKQAFRRAIGRILESQVKRLITSHSLTVVAVGGSVGKTTTKMSIARVLSVKYRVMVQEGNYNSEISLPLMVFGQTVPSVLFNPFAWAVRMVRSEVMIHGTYPYDVLVLELGTDHPGEIAHFMTYLKPAIGVVTAVTPEHMENFATLDAVAEEELALAAGSTTALINDDDVSKLYLDKFLASHKQRLSYGLSPDGTYSVKTRDADLVGGTDCIFLKRGHATMVGVTLGVYGAPSVKAAAASYAVGDLLGLTRADLEAGLALLTPVAGRMRIFAGINGSTIIDDTYNSSPEAVAAAMAALAGVPGAGRRIAVMGSMNELGIDTARYHKESGALCSGVDYLVTIGELAGTYLGPAAVAAGLDPSRFKPADSPYAAGEFLRLIIGPGDVVLAKGSQNGVFAEETVKLLLANPADGPNLVRQSDAWLKIKAKQFQV